MVYSEEHREGSHMLVCALKSIYVRVIEELEEEGKKITSRTYFIRSKPDLNEEIPLIRNSDGKWFLWFQKVGISNLK